MFWNEDNATVYKVPQDIVDINFKIKCAHLPLDHAYHLSTAILNALPCLQKNNAAGIHLIHGAESGNGWIRPSGPAELIYPSRRTLFTIRAPREHIEEVKTLDGQSIAVGDVTIEFSKPSIRGLSRLTTLFARYVLTDHIDDENAFLNDMAQLLLAKNIRARKMMSGRAATFRFPDKTYSVRSLMIDGLDISESVRLQQQGLGGGRKFGCGLFLPHKGIDAVGDAQEK